jgi:hypothetical protein
MEILGKKIFAVSIHARVVCGLDVSPDQQRCGWYAKHLPDVGPRLKTDTAFW